MAFPKYSLRSYAGGATPTTLATSIAANDLSFTLNSTTNWYETDLVNSTGHPSANPLGNSGPFVVALDYGTATEEKILCSSVVLSTGVVTVWVDPSNSSNTGRGYDGSAAQPHTSGSSGTALPVFTSTEAGVANYAVQQTVGQITGAGDTFYGTAANTLGILTAGTLGQVLTAQGAASPQWQTNRGTSYYSAAASPPSAPTQGQVWYQTDTHALLVYSGSAWLNTYPSGVPAGRMYQTSQTVIASGAGGTLTNMTADYLKGGMTFSSNALFVPVTGIYSVTVSGGFQVSGGAPPAANYAIEIFKNGSQNAYTYLNLPAVSYPTANITNLVNCSAGDYLQIYLFNGSGTNVGSEASSLTTFLTAVLVSQ